jgi:Transglutaminase-like superfamily
MSMPEAVFYQPRAVPLPRRLVTHLAVGAARLLATRSPRRIRTVLGRLRRGAVPATFEQAKAARDAVVAVSLHCAAREGCLARSLATVLLCRLGGQWPTWCVGARPLPPSPPTPGSKPTGSWSARTTRLTTSASCSPCPEPWP